MVRLVYSNRTEELLAELATRVRAQQARDGALVPVRVVVPSAGVDAYVRLGIARECGIAANLESTRLTGFAADMVAALSVPSPASAASAASGAPVRVADAAAIEAMALALLLDDAALEHPDLAPVRAYLRGGGEADDPMDIRRVQLAARIGRLFEEYTFSRGDLLAAWPKRTQLGERHAESVETERWQRRMWLAIFGEDGLASRRAGPDAPRIVPLSEAVASLVPDRLRKDALPTAVHVFGFAHVARTFHDLFERLARVTDVVVYSLSPCEGFWEDPDPRDPAPLHLWGRAGRDQVRALNAIAGFDHDDRFVDPLEPAPAPQATDASKARGRASPTLLHAMQSDVLRREPARDAVDPRLRFERDESIVVLEHASVRRELEAVASEIWRLVRADPTLRFDAIAVAVPDEDSAPYTAQLPAVFREAFALPHRLSGVTPPTVEGGSLVEAVHLLLSLPLGRFTRHELLRLVVHPAIVASIEDVDPTRWTAWCEALGVVHGADRTDHADTYIARDIVNWDQGLRRLALGTFMVGDTGDASGAQAPFVVGDDAYLPHEVGGSELRDAAAFGLLVRSLLGDARFARDAKLTMREWAAFLRTMVETYVAPRGSAEEEELARCLRRLHGVGDAGPADDVPVRYRIAREVAVRRVASAPSSAGGEGVVVSTIASLRPVPFRVVFACGLGEGQFPSSEGEDPLDLRWMRRREGDVSGRERDKFAFLELLLSTRDRLYVSYVSRDPLSGEALEPSSVVQELLYALERGYVRDMSRLRRRHPLRRWDPEYFPELFAANSTEPGVLGTMHIPEAGREARTLALRRSRDALGGSEFLDADAIVERAATDPAWQALATHLGLVSLPPIAAFPDGRLSVPMYALVKFLEFPLQGWARFRLGLDERDDEDVMAREDEPFETDIRRETLFLRDVLLDAGARQRPLEEAYDAAVRDRELRGAGPSGVFAKGERGPHLETLAAWRDELLANGESAGALAIYRFGRAGEHSRADQVFGPVVLDMDVVDHAGVTRVLRVEVGGRTLPMGADAASSITLAKRPKDKRDDPWAEADRERTALRAFVDHAILSAGGVTDGKAHASLIVTRTPDGSMSERITFRPLSRDEAVVWLRGIVRELLAESHPYFLPCEAVFVHASRDPDGPVTRWIEDARARLGDAEGALALRSAYGPVPRPHEYPAPGEAQARAVIARRFAAFLDHRDAEARP